MTEQEWDNFMQRLYALPPMGATPRQDTQDFWREMDALAQPQNASKDTD